MTRITEFSAMGDAASIIPLLPKHAVNPWVQASSHDCLEPKANTYLLYGLTSTLQCNLCDTLHALTVDK